MADPKATPLIKITNAYNYIMDNGRALHDTVFGSFMGMATIAVDYLVKPCVKKAAEKYLEYQRVANVVGSVAIGVGAYYQPWTVLCSTCCVVTPIAYFRDPPVGLSAESSAADRGARTAASLCLQHFRNPGADVSEETREAVIKVMKEFTSLLEVAIEIGGQAGVMAKTQADSLKSIYKKKNPDGFTEMMIDLYFQELISYLVSNDDDYDQIYKGKLHVRKYDYDRLTNIFLNVAGITAGNLGDPDCRQTQLGLIKELIKEWKDPLDKQLRRLAMQKLLVGKSLDMYTQLEGRAGNTTVAVGANKGPGSRPVGSSDVAQGVRQRSVGHVSSMDNAGRDGN